MLGKWTLGLGLSLAAAGSVAAAATAMSVKVEMKKVVEPASNALFAIGGYVDPANGPDALKVPAARWTEAATAAQKLQTVAHSLSLKGRAKPGRQWAKFVRAMNADTAAALKAAKAHDGAGLSAAANNLSDTCSACHAKFKPQTAG